VSGKKDYRLISRSIELQKIDQIRIYFFIKDLRGQTKDVFDNQGNRTTHFCFVREFLNMISNQGKMKLKKKFFKKIANVCIIVTMSKKLKKRVKTCNKVKVL